MRTKSLLELILLYLWLRREYYFGRTHNDFPECTCDVCYPVSYHLKVQYVREESLRQRTRRWRSKARWKRTRQITIFVNKQFYHINEMICIWSDISRHRLLFFEGARHGSGGLHRVKETWFLSHRCYSQNFHPPHPWSAALSECWVWLHLCYDALYTLLIAEPLIYHVLGLSCPWSAVPMMYRRLHRLGLGYAVMFDRCFARLLGATVFTY